jgi:hypothetical protein
MIYCKFLKLFSISFLYWKINPFAEIDGSEIFTKWNFNEYGYKNYTSAHSSASKLIGNSHTFSLLMICHLFIFGTEFLFLTWW